MRVLGFALAAFFAAATLAAPARAQDVSVRLRERPGRQYEVEGAFEVKAPSAVVWGVLTDYERIPRFIRGMRSSRVAERRPDGSVLVEQEATARCFFFYRVVRVLLRVTRGADRLDFEDLHGSDFKRYVGSWEAEPTAGGLRIVYRLHAEPAFAAPGVLVRCSFDRAARELLEQVRAEIHRRASAG